ncbi:MAG: hypothetical protein K8T25_18445 [Planctomycetia bacterium]|nr:hypothetical protein [Planctomycetia bacterium]
MATSTSGYSGELVDRFGRGWNRFWYQPSDPYVLGALRMMTGLLALYFVLSFTPDLIRLFGDGGLLPNSVSEHWYMEANSNGLNPTRLSFLSHLHTTNELYAGHAIAAAVLVLMTVGLFSRVTTVLGLYVVLSYIHRGPQLATQVEAVLAILMFYLCFGPTGKAMSIDRWLAVRRARKNPAALAQLNRKYFSATIVTRLIQIHLALGCLMMGLSQLRGVMVINPTTGLEWQDPWGAGMAVWWMIARPESRWLNMTWLRNWPLLVNAWTHAIIFFELAFPVLIWNKLARPLMLLSALLIWGSLALISGIAPFCAAMLIGSLAFVSPEALRRGTGGATPQPMPAMA